ncbi:MAG: hypothetical protein IID39_09170, partial [Planctomycetes bacterium]|nr:hypothetical protein [Planctomycetota bacterium]
MASALLGAGVQAQDVSKGNDAVTADPVNRSVDQPANDFSDFDCAYRTPGEWLAEVRAAVARGEIPDPATRPIPPIAPGKPRARLGETPCLSGAHIFPFEDTKQILLTNFSNGELIDLMVTAANDLLATHGDNYDFVGYWVNFTPHHTIGTAFYKFIENDVQGIGDPSTQGTPIFNFRPDLGLGGENIEGFIMMWNINDATWQPGDGPNADFTRLALGQEFEHRFAMFLPDLLDGRSLQGNNGSCGRVFHWNWRVDGQGSSMEISEWVGSNPAELVGSFVTFNTDIPGSVFSYTDLYLMGYVSPAEMDAGNSELRYMDSSNCSRFYFGDISDFSSADIVGSAGPRIPDSEAAQKHFRTGWIMIHQPGDPPSQSELAKAVAIHEQHMIDWDVSTLSRGTMNNSLFDDCNCNDVPDADDIAKGTSQDTNDNGVPDEYEIFIVHGNPDWDRDDPDTWISFNDFAFGGYIDPKIESTNGNEVNLGLDTFTIAFSSEPFGDAAGGPVTIANVSVEETGKDTPPDVVNVTKKGNKLTVVLDRIITLQEWTTLIFDVF